MSEPIVSVPGVNSRRQSIPSGRLRVDGRDGGAPRSIWSVWRTEVGMGVSAVPSRPAHDRCVRTGCRGQAGASSGGGPPVAGPLTAATPGSLS
jgi:hypothetical protein